MCKSFIPHFKIENILTKIQAKFTKEHSELLEIFKLKCSIAKQMLKSDFWLSEMDGEDFAVVFSTFSGMKWWKL